MRSAFKEPDFDSAAEAQGNAKRWWIAVGVLVVALMAALFVGGRKAPDASEARVRHILVKFDQMDPSARNRAMETIKDLKQQLSEGADFGKLAQEYSNDNWSSQLGGDLGYVAKDFLEKAIDDYVWNAEIGKVSDVIVGSVGYHLVVVEDRRLSEADQHEQEMKRRATESGGN